MRFLLLIFSLPALVIQAGEPIKTLEYEVLFSGAVAGSQTSNYYPDGRIVVDFAFQDRGRGPKIHGEYQLDQIGYPQSMKLVGNSYMGSEVNEEFAVEKGVSSWKSSAEKGSKSTQTPHFYSTINGTPEETAIGIRLMEKTGTPLSLLPSGQVSCEKLLNLVLKEKDVSLYAVRGIGASPDYVWMDDQLDLLAMVSDWTTIIRKGYGGFADQLLEIQNAEDQKLLKSTAEANSTGGSGMTLIRDVALFDSLSGTVLEGQTVFLYNHRITAIYQGETQIPEDAVVIEGKGHMLLPGLWDMHGHISAWQGILHLAGGVTSLRDMGNNPAIIEDLEQKFDRNEVLGPNLIACGFIDKQSPYSAPTGKLARSLEEALTFVDEYARLGYPQIKIYSSIDPSWVAPIAEAVHQRGMRLSGHIPSFMTTEAAIRAGYNEIQHINMLFLNFLAGPEDDTRTPLRFSIVGDRAGKLDLDSPQVNEFIQLLRDRQIVVDPTVSIFEGIFLNKDGQMSPSFAMVADHFPVSLQRSYLAGEMDINDQNEANYKNSFQAMLKLIKKLSDAGVTLVPGTDSLPGFALHRELELYVAAGIPTAKVLQMATIESARVMKQDGITGSITAGKRADLILVEGNPFKDISDIRKVALVFKNGYQYRPSDLYRVCGFKPFIGEK